MEIKDKEYTLGEITELVNSQEGDFIINIIPEVDKDEDKGSV